MLSENLTEKDKYCVITSMWNSKNKTKEEMNITKQKQTYWYREHPSGYQEGERRGKGARDRGRGWRGTKQHVLNKLDIRM